jgi:hypothetical protein
MTNVMRLPAVIPAYVSDRHSGMFLAGIQVLSGPWTPARSMPG